MAGTAAARTYDLANPPLLRPGEEAAALRKAAALERAFTDLAGAYLSRPVRASFAGLVEPQDVAGVAEDLNWFAPPQQGREPAPCVGISSRLGGQFAARMVGARGPTGDAEPTAVERELLGHLCGQVVPGCLAAWGCAALLPDSWSCSGSPVNEGPRAGLLLRFEGSCDAGEGALAFWLPAGMVRDEAPGPVRRRTDASGPAAHGVQQATVRAAVVLGSHRTTLAGLAALQPGDVISLGTPSGAPLEMRIQGRAQLLVRPGLCRGRIAVQVIGDQSAQCEFREHHPGDPTAPAG